MVHFKLKVFTLSFLASCALLCSPSHGFERQIHLKPTVATVKSEICLDEMVQDSQDAWVKFECERNPRTCCLWNLEESANEMKISVSQIEDKLRESSFLKASVSSAFSVPSPGFVEIRVERTGRPLNFVDLESKVKAELERLNTIYDQGYELQEIKSAQTQMVPLTAKIKVSFSKSKLQQMATFQVLTEDGVILGSALVRLQNIRPVILTARSLKAGDPISGKDLTTKTIDIFLPEYAAQLQTAGGESLKASQLSELSQVRAKTSLRQGQLLLASHLDRAPLVNAGETVTLLLTSDNLKISAKGNVQGSASLGDTVTVNLRNYGRTFRGTLREGKVVEVFL